MNLYTSLTLRYLKENKKRTIVTIIGIILSTALICGIGNIYESMMDYEIRETVESDGGFHATFDNINKEDMNVITKSAGISKYGYSNNLGSSKLKKDKENLLQVKAYDKTTFESYNITLKEGRIPKSDNEIVISEDAISVIDKKIGDNITLNIGTRTSEQGEEANGPWISANEKIINSKKEKYKIVGIMNKPGYEFGKQVVTGITYLDINTLSSDSTVNVSICANKPKEIYEITSSVLENLNLKGNNKYSYTYNEHLLRLQGASAYENIDASMAKIIILVTSLVIVCTIATVYNAFSISISERKKQFGILNSIGATKSQTMKLVFLEAFLVSVIGIPIGLLSGTVAIDIVFKVIQILFSNSLIGTMDLRVVYSPHVITLSAVIVLLTIFVSAIMPAISASKVSPLDAIKNSDNLKIGKVRDSKIVKALFKTEGVLAYKNLRRNKKKFIITLFSLIVSVVIFISFSGFMNLFMKAQNIQNGQLNYDLQLFNSLSEQDENIVKELKNVKGIENIVIDNTQNITLKLDEQNMNEKYKDLVEEYYEKNSDGIYEIINCNLKMPGNQSISKINLKEGSFNKEEAIKENGIILVENSYYEQPGKKGEIKMTNYKVGDTITIYRIDYDEEGNEEKTKDMTLKILGITDDIPIGNYSYNNMGLDFVTYDEVGKKLGFDIFQNSIFVVSDKSENTIKVVKEISNKYDYELTNNKEIAEEMENTIKVMQIFVYGFVTVISLVSVTNIVNTISTNINLRKRELAIIKSIGVTPNGFNKMIYLESLLYGGLSLIYGIPLGLGLVVLMNVFLGDVIQFGLILPWGDVLISTIGIFIITFISSYIPMKKINKENIIENIRQESI